MLVEHPSTWQHSLCVRKEVPSTFIVLSSLAWAPCAFSPPPVPRPGATQCIRPRLSGALEEGGRVRARILLGAALASIWLSKQPFERDKDKRLFIHLLLNPNRGYWSWGAPLFVTRNPTGGCLDIFEACHLPHTYASGTCHHWPNTNKLHSAAGAPTQQGGSTLGVRASQKPLEFVVLPCFEGVSLWSQLPTFCVFRAGRSLTTKQEPLARVGPGSLLILVPAGPKGNSGRGLGIPWSCRFCPLNVCLCDSVCVCVCFLAMPFWGGFRGKLKRSRGKVKGHPPVLKCPYFDTPLLTPFWSPMP